MTFLGYTPATIFAPRRRTDTPTPPPTTEHTLIIGRGIRMSREGA